MQKVFVDLHNQKYPIYIGENFLTEAQLLRQEIKGQQVLVVSNETVAPLYLKSIENALSGLQVNTVILPDGENYKNEESLFTIYDQLISHNHHRDTTLVALGGGVIGDITGFAAATYQRGVKFIQIPTTLLAQVDASVGGKTAINHPRAKNMIGSFYQPKAVFIDVNTLKTLPDRELKAGFGEVIKYAFLEGGEFLTTISQALLSASSLRELPYHEMIAACCQIKAKFVQQDEREQGVRALLNLGHTFAHALESYSHYTRWLHGEAVAIGLYCAARLSYDKGVLGRESLDEVDSLLKLLDLPRRIPNGIDLQGLISCFNYDKKIKNNKMRFVLIQRPGLCYLDDTVTESELLQVLTEAVEGD